MYQLRAAIPVVLATDDGSPLFSMWAVATDRVPGLERNGQTFTGYAFALSTDKKHRPVIQDDDRLIRNEVYQRVRLALVGDDDDDAIMDIHLIGEYGDCVLIVGYSVEIEARYRFNELYKLFITEQALAKQAALDEYNIESQEWLNEFFLENRQSQIDQLAALSGGAIPIGFFRDHRTGIGGEIQVVPSKRWALIRAVFSEDEEYFREERRRKDEGQAVGDEEDGTEGNDSGDSSDSEGTT